MNILSEKLKETSFSVIPITFIVLILNFTVLHLETHILIRFLIGAFMIVLGLSIFLLGVDISISPIGRLVSSTLTKKNRLVIIIIADLILGFFISVAEPDLHILAGQVDSVTAGVISKLNVVIFVSVGIAIMLTLGLIRILYNIPLYKVLTVLYVIILGLSFFTSSELLAISFDASGATTGAMTVPFILALSLGTSTMKKDSKTSEKDSFGLVAIVSTGAIFGIMLMNLFSKSGELTSSIEQNMAVSDSILNPFIENIPTIASELLLALFPFLVIFLVFQFAFFKLPKRAFIKILIGLLYTFLGLFLFLSGVQSGFMEVGNITGYTIASLDNKVYIILIGFVLGVVTILAEPAVHVLTNQIEDVTSRYVKKNAVFVSLCLGVGLAVALSIVRIIIPGLNLWHYLLPGYFISILMTYFTPKLFVGIAFDSGGVATGPMTATFILAFTQGAAKAIEGADVLKDGFGMIAMVALMPIITMQLLGIIYQSLTKKEGAKTHGNEL